MPQIGINLGKSKVTELKDAPQDYRESFRLLRSFGAYFVINVSSPNTPGLRDLQAAEKLESILRAIATAVPTRPPLLVKIAPDLSDRGLEEVIGACICGGAAGTGLYAGRTGCQIRPGYIPVRKGAGGWREQAGGDMSGGEAAISYASTCVLNYLPTYLRICVYNQ